MSTLFDKDYTKISHICSRNVEHCYSLAIISMEKVNLNYSTKNIPIPSERSYLLKLTEKIELVIKRMRWKAIYFSEGKEKRNQTEWYGLKSTMCPGKVNELVPFEKNLIALVKNVKFRKVKNHFQKKLQHDIKMIRTSDKTLTFADKTNNMYRLSKDQYNMLLNNSITSIYKKSNNNIKKKINISGRNILKEKEVLQRMDINGESNCFITLKDHKENFQNNPSVRLINPAKNELGRLSKFVIQAMNKELRHKFNLNQWKNTEDVIDWFKRINEKQLCKFVIFDIKDFYPSIKESLLKQSLDFAEKHIKISTEDKAIIKHARKSLLFNKQQTWIKKESGLFDVTMGAYDGAEVCELVGIFILHQLSRVYNNNNIGLYRDDGLAVFKNISGPQAEKIKKHFQNIFRKNNLNIIVKCNLKVVDYLDVTLNLSDGSYKPFHKPNSEINYIHRESNHPPTIIKQLPLSVESRLSKLSSDENVFIQAASVYQEALKRAGYKHKLKYKNSNKYNSNNNNNQHICNSNDTKNDTNYNNNKFKFDHNDKWDKDDNNNKDNFNGYESKDSNDNNNNNVKFYSNDNRGNINSHNNYNSNSNDNRDNIKNKDTNNNNRNNNNNNNNDNMESNYNNNPRKRNRNIIWFNPPFSKNVATKIGRYFLNLLDKHFPQDHKFHKIFNRNNIKVSYSCMPNIKSAIN